MAIQPLNRNVNLARPAGGAGPAPQPAAARPGFNFQDIFQRGFQAGQRIGGQARPQQARARPQPQQNQLMRLIQQLLAALRRGGAQRGGGGQRAGGGGGGQRAGGGGGGQPQGAGGGGQRAG